MEQFSNNQRPVAQNSYEEELAALGDKSYLSSEMM
jgi:hypothetical protein